MSFGYGATGVSNSRGASMEFTQFVSRHSKIELKLKKKALIQ
jgi:hypothetical protein